MAKFLITMPEARGKSTERRFALLYENDEHDGVEFARGLEERGHEVYWTSWLDLEDGELGRMFSYRRQRFVEPLPIGSMDLIFAYKFKGHYRDLDRFHRMIDRFEAASAPVVNDPRTIRHNLDKSYYWDLEKTGLPVIPAFPVNGRLAQRLERGEALVLKPRRGECGEGIYLARSAADLALVAGRENEYLAQKFLPGVRGGERSLAFLGRELQHAVVKHPPSGDPAEFRCNESLGGTVAAYRPTSEEIAFAVAVLDAYATLGYPVHFSRIDLLHTRAGPALVEAELTNPSMFANYAGHGRAFGRAVARYLEGLLG